MPGFKQCPPNTKRPSFDDLFNREEYLENFMGGDREFAKQFSETQLFSAFFDSYLED